MKQQDTKKCLSKKALKGKREDAIIGQRDGQGRELKKRHLKTSSTKGGKEKEIEAGRKQEERGCREMPIGRVLKEKRKEAKSRQNEKDTKREEALKGGKAYKRPAEQRKMQ